ncbi:MAG: magnesium and cobalt transport protein CorA, partial [Proteobacteria bacterium]|nr:magnesium and cobalt transport protein CorA [Pseudomonadota bacterium]
MSETTRIVVENGDIVESMSDKAGLMPGSLVAVGEQRVEQSKITGIHYDAEKLDHQESPTDEDLHYGRTSPLVAWFRVIGVHDVELIKRVGRIYDLHPLVMEDIVNTQQRPKLENFDDYLFIVLKIPKLDDGELRLDQISIVFGHGYVLVFAEDEEKPLDMVAERLRRGRGRIRKAGADYLTYAVVDAVVDSFFTVLVE